MSPFGDEDLKRLKEQLKNPAMDQEGHDKWAALLARLEAAEGLVKFVGCRCGPETLCGSHEALDVWRKASGRWGNERDLQRIFRDLGPKVGKRKAAGRE